MTSETKQNISVKLLILNGGQRRDRSFHGSYSSVSYRKYNDKNSKKYTSPGSAVQNWYKPRFGRPVVATDITVVPISANLRAHNRRWIVETPYRRHGHLLRSQILMGQNRQCLMPVVERLQMEDML
jgi:hypothetical protein